jgi:hypothetical protein
LLRRSEVGWGAIHRLKNHEDIFLFLPRLSLLPLCYSAMNHDIPIEKLKPAAEAQIPEEGLVQELAPPSIRLSTVDTRTSAKEVTIRQVAPLVLILTGATFLNAS